VSDEFEIRHLHEGDAPTYRTLRLRALREDGVGFGTTYEDAAARPLEATLERLRPQESGGFTLGAFAAGGTLVGITTLLVEKSRKERHRAEVVSVYVAPEARRRGVARELLRESIAHAATVPGVEQLRLAVVTESAGARTLYHSLGFVPYGIEPRALKDGDRYYDEEWMMLILEHPAPLRGVQ